MILFCRLFLHLGTLFLELTADRVVLELGKDRLSTLDNLLQRGLSGEGIEMLGRQNAFPAGVLLYRGKEVSVLDVIREGREVSA